jgi:TonB family protein
MDAPASTVYNSPLKTSPASQKKSGPAPQPPPMAAEKQFQPPKLQAHVSPPKLPELPTPPQPKDASPSMAELATTKPALAAVIVPAPPPQPQQTQTTISSRLPQAVEANKRGSDLFKTGQGREAIAYFTEAISMAPNFALAYFNRAQVYYSLGRLQEAVVDYDKAMALDPSLATDARSHLQEARERIAGRLYTLDDSVTPPKLVMGSKPSYTREALKARLQGSVLLHIVVNEHGIVTECNVIRGLGMGLDEKAMEAVRNWRFTPAQKDGKWVSVVVTVKVDFSLSQ